jgi:hypothetical protein
MCRVSMLVAGFSFPSLLLDPSPLPLPLPSSLAAGLPFSFFLPAMSTGMFEKGLPLSLCVKLQETQVVADGGVSLHTSCTLLSSAFSMIS